jgi:hypothetical protein
MSNGVAGLCLSGHIYTEKLGLFSREMTGLPIWNFLAALIVRKLVAENGRITTVYENYTDRDDERPQREGRQIRTIRHSLMSGRP